MYNRGVESQKKVIEKQTSEGDELGERLAGVDHSLPSLKEFLHATTPLAGHTPRLLERGKDFQRR